MEDNQHLENICIKQVVVLQKKETINKIGREKIKLFESLVLRIGITNKAIKPEMSPAKVRA